MSGIAVSGRHTLEGRRPDRWNEVEYVTPGGGTVFVPMSACPYLLEEKRLAGYRYVRTLGRKVDEVTYENLITNEGLAGIAKMLIDSSAAYDTGIKRVEIGTGGGSAVVPDEDDTTLAGGQVRYACNTPTQSAGVITVVTPTTTASNGIYIREVGVFFANDTATISAGDLLSYVATNYDNSGAPVNLTITSTIDLTRMTSS